MYCPKCKSEFTGNLTRCPDCDIPLEGSYSENLEAGKLILEIVFETAEPILIQMVTSILNDAKIQFTTKSYGLQTIYGFGMVKFLVKEEDADTAIELLKDLKK